MIRADTQLGKAVPPQVEYTLTSVGNSLLPIIAQMAQWGTQYLLRDPVFPTDEE
jgi:DNA-binding HxlR family transcriptional regulator